MGIGGSLEVIQFRLPLGCFGFMALVMLGSAPFSIELHEAYESLGKADFT